MLNALEKKNVENSSEKIEITSAGVRKSLNAYKEYEAVIEYIWNSFDAKATVVNVDFKYNSIGGVTELSISDNGDGIDFEKLDAKFKPFFQSEKISEQIVAKKKQNSTYHGKNGVGRLTFFKFANNAKWVTRYRTQDSQIQQYEIEIDASNLTDYSATNHKTVLSNTGTTVSFYNFSFPIAADILEEEVAKEFCWFLFLRKNAKIFINNKLVDILTLIQNRDEGTIILGDETFDWEYVNWSTALNNEYSKYYFLDDSGIERFKDFTTYNKKGDKFYHSIYVKSKFFNAYIASKEELGSQQLSIFENQNKLFKQLICELDKIIFEKRKPYIKEYSKKVIEDLNEVKAFDFYDVNNIAEQFKRGQLELFIRELFIIEPKLFVTLNKEQKLTFVRLLDYLAFSSDKDSIFKIFENVLDMTESDRKDLADLVDVSPLTNITKTIKLLIDRLTAISYFEKMVYEPHLNANEVIDLQTMLEENYWLFGEKYFPVAAAEDNFVKLVKNHLDILRKDDGEINQSIVAQIVANPDKYKQPDLCLTRQLTGYEFIENIVVEIKHPDKTISREHYDQIRKYMEILTSIREFAADNYRWTFFLIGTKISDAVQDDLNNSKGKGKEHLIFEKNNHQIEIYVRTWKSIFNGYKIKYKSLHDRLKVDEKSIASNPKNKNELHEMQKKLTVF